jgi:hypothetical protein
MRPIAPVRSGRISRVVRHHPLGIMRKAADLSPARSWVLDRGYGTSWVRTSEKTHLLRRSRIVLLRPAHDREDR